MAGEENFCRFKMEDTSVEEGDVRFVWQIEPN